MLKFCKNNHIQNDNNSYKEWRNDRKKWVIRCLLCRRGRDRKRWPKRKPPPKHHPLPIERFLLLIENPQDNIRCWIWKGKKNIGGYSRFWIDNREVFGHRWSYEYFIGPIGDNLHLDHLCRVRACVNPFHLGQVTIRENNLRGISPSAINASKTHCIHGHEFNLHNTYYWQGRRACRTCRNNTSLRNYYGKKNKKSSMERVTEENSSTIGG